MKMIDFTSEKESYTHLKLMLIKIASMLNEDIAYTRETAFYDILKVIKHLEEYDKEINYVLKSSAYGDHLETPLKFI